jgi:hypothetical protein
MMVADLDYSLDCLIQPQLRRFSLATQTGAIRANLYFSLSIDRLGCDASNWSSQRSAGPSSLQAGGRRAFIQLAQCKNAGRHQPAIGSFYGSRI